MRQVCLIILYIIFGIQWLFVGAVGKADTFEYPSYLLDSYNPDNDCWLGVDAPGHWPVRVIPENWLVGPPPALDRSGVTLPIDHWVELGFCGGIVNGVGEDVVLVELDAVGEQALLFLTDGVDQEYLLNLADVPSTGGHNTTSVGFDIAGVTLPFVPRAVRIVGVDLRGGSPGFDLAYVRARTSNSYSNIACNPNPVDGAKNVPVDTVLGWSTGISAEKHAVYFSQTRADVSENAAVVGLSPQLQESDSYDPCGLKLNTTYFWRVDELNTNDVNNPLTGDIWKFKTVDYLVLDDFESYQRDEVLDTWTPIEHAQIKLTKEPGIVRGCQQSMAFSYYFDENYCSQATYDFNSVWDWASMGARSLELYFRGEANNDTAVRMYVALSDGDVQTIVSYDGDANDLRDKSWRLWRIDLEDFVNVDMNKIRSLSIGFYEYRSTPTGNGAGTVYFDDIGLYPSRCLEENRPRVDFNEDCMVGFNELQEVTKNWLETGYKVYEIAAPNAPVAWYKFDDNLNDTIGNAHGHMRVNPAYVPGVYGRAIRFDGYGSSVEITNAINLFSGINKGITIAFWQYGDTSAHHTDTLCCSNFVYGVYNPTIAVNLGLWKSPGKYNWDCGSRWSFDGRLSGHHQYNSEWSGRWNHWAFTKDVESGMMQIFHNGVLYDSRNNATTPLEGIISFEIGSGWYGGYDGLIDDFRIYDYALSGPEVAHAATNGTGIFDQPLMLPADLNNDNTIDFEDFAVLAGEWLEKNFWP